MTDRAATARRVSVSAGVATDSKRVLATTPCLETASLGAETVSAMARPNAPMERELTYLANWGLKEGPLPSRGPYCYLVAVSAWCNSSSSWSMTFMSFVFASPSSCPTDLAMTSEARRKPAA